MNERTNADTERGGRWERRSDREDIKDERTKDIKKAERKKVEREEDPSKSALLCSRKRLCHAMGSERERCF